MSASSRASNILSIVLFQWSGVFLHPRALREGFAPLMRGSEAGLNFVCLSAVSDLLNTEPYFLQIALTRGGSLPSTNPWIDLTSVLVSNTESGIAILEL